MWDFEAMGRMMKAIMKESGHEVEGQEGPEMEESWYRWLGSKVVWGGMETNRMCQGFHRIVGWMQGEEMEEG